MSDKYDMEAYKDFWIKLSARIKDSDIDLEVDSSDEYEYLRLKSSTPSIYYAFIVEYHFPEVMIEIDGNIEENDYYYDSLMKQRSDIEDEFGNELIWTKRTKQRNSHRVSFKDLRLNYKRVDQWTKIIDFMIENTQKLYQIFQVRVEILYDNMQKEKKRKSYTGPALIESIKLSNFMGFRDLDIKLSEGINLFMGENDTGKTGLMKLMYALSKSFEIYSRKEYYSKVSYKRILGEKMFDIFQPRETRRLGELVSKYSKDKFEVNVMYKLTNDYKQNISVKFGENTYKTITDCPDEVDTTGLEFNCIFIPAKEVLTAFKTIKYIKERLFLPGFDDTYIDLIQCMEAPMTLDKTPNEMEHICTLIDKVLPGEIKYFNAEEPFIFNKQNKRFSISLTSEGIKKVSMLSSLIRKRQIQKGSFLFFDEPEANLPPRTVRQLMDIVVQMSKHNVQSFISSHSYVVLAQLALSAKKHNIPVTCFTLKRDANDQIRVEQEDLSKGLPSNAITDEMEKLRKEIQELYGE